MSSTSASPIPPSQERRCCPNCQQRMSSTKFDLHVICSKCRGNKCSFENRCDLCKSWPDEVMQSYDKHQRSLELKRKAKKARKEGDVLMEVCTGAVGSQPPMMLWM